MIFLFVGILLLAGAIPLFIQGGNAEKAEVDERPQTEILRDTHPGVTNLVIASDAGDVRIGAGPDGSAQTARVLRWTGDAKPEITDEVVGDTLRITVRCPEAADGGQSAVDIMATLPAGGTVETAVGTGDITIDGLAGQQSLTTAAGDVLGIGLRADRVEARSSAGEITLRFAVAPSRVQVSGVAGDVQVVLPDGDAYVVEGGSETGEVMVTVAQDAAAGRRITASTGSGDVMVVAD